MTKIEYSLYGRLGEWRAFSRGDSMLELSFPGQNSGLVILGGSTYPIKNGVCIVNTSLHKDGIYNAKIDTGDGLVELEPIRIERGKATPTLTDDSVIRRLCARVESLERRLEEQANALSELTKRMGNHLKLF
ncbi:MAG: hypothetical protein IJY24_05485 [Clostridia bacterium]|nr:hypothetical protein [Clostridia bacterium]